MQLGIKINRSLEVEIDAEEITIENKKILEEVIKAYTDDKENDYESLIFDFKKVKYMDSSGIGVLISINNKIKKTVVLKNCNSIIKDTLNLLNLKGKFEWI